MYKSINFRRLGTVLRLNRLKYINSDVLSYRKVSGISRSPKPKIVILGSGWGSYSVLKNIKRKAFDLKIITPRNHFLFTPLLCSTTVGTLEFRSIIEPIRNIGLNNPDDLLLANAESVDFNKQEVTCRSVLDDSIHKLNYDILVIGVGCISNTFGIPGVEKYACFLKEIPDAQRIRLTILKNCEAALFTSSSENPNENLLQTVIVGGGPTGVEFGAELYDFITHDVRKLYRFKKELCRVFLIEGSNILASFDAKLRAYAEKKLEERTNFKLIKSTVIEVKEHSVVLKDGTVIPCGLVVWSTGLAPRPFTKSLGLPLNSRGQILTDRYLRAIGDPSGKVYALGDCAEIESDALPCTAQVAEKEGRYVASLLNDTLKSRNTEEFRFQSKGMLTYLGDYKAVTDTRDFKTKGFISWFLWRSAYFTRLGSWRLRMQVPMDWLKTLCFGRDTSRF